MDSRGILGWDKVEGPLLNYGGYRSPNIQASEIKELYHNLLEYNNKLVFNLPSPIVHPQRNHIGEENEI